MKRGITVLLSLTAVVTVGYFTASKWAIRHETITLHDPSRGNRPVRSISRCGATRKCRPMPA